MVDQYLNLLIAALQNIPAEFTSFLMYIVCVLFIVFACKFGFTGLCVYNALAMIMGNLQVLRLGHYAITSTPIALGTVLFATTFLVTDIITENFGPKRSRQCILICFVAQLVVTLWMILCLGHKGGTSADQVAITASLTLIFIPQARFLSASIISYTISQLTDIAIYQWVRQISHNKYLWLRQNIARFIAGLIDNLIFSILAWIIFNPIPLPWDVVLISYVLAGYIIRAIVNILGTPILYWSKHLVPKR